MTNAQWFLLVGGLLLTRGLSASLLKNLPVTPAIVYLTVGLLVGPTVLNFFHFNPLKESALLEVLTEVVVLISLFSAGVKMPVPVSLARADLAGLGVDGGQRRLDRRLCLLRPGLATGCGHLAGCHFVAHRPGAGHRCADPPSGRPRPTALHPDLRSRHERRQCISVCDAGAGLLGLHNLGDSGLRWVLVDVLWATAAGIGIDVAAGVALAHLGRKLRQLVPNHTLMNDFLGLGLIGVVYGLSVMVDAWGFLAVFFAAVALRQTEVRHLNARQPILAHEPDKAQTSIGPTADPKVVTETISAQSLVFKEHLERLSELMLVLLIGGSLFLDSWSWRAVALALFVFAVVRPVSVMAGLLGTRASWTIRGLIGWFGVRGIGSLYYLMFSIQQGLPEDLALELMQLTLFVVTLSIFVHGTSVKPLLGRFWRLRQPLIRRPPSTPPPPD